MVKNGGEISYPLESEVGRSLYRAKICLGTKYTWPKRKEKHLAVKILWDQENLVTKAAETVPCGTATVPCGTPIVPYGTLPPPKFKRLLYVTEAVPCMRDKYRTVLLTLLTWRISIREAFRVFLFIIGD